MDVDKSGGEFTILDGMTFTFNDDVIVVKFGIGV
jgi:hypothetical protein